MKWQTCGILTCLLLIGCARSDIFSTDVLYGAEVTSRSLYESYNSGSTVKTILLTDHAITIDGHLIGFSFYHHPDILFDLTNHLTFDYKVYLGIWRHNSGSSYQLIQGMEPVYWNAYDQSGSGLVITETSGVAKIIYSSNPMAVQPGDFIGISISESTSPIAYSESGAQCTYTEGLDTSGSWPPYDFDTTFSTTTMNCRQYSLQAIVDTKYISPEFSSCQFLLSQTVHSFMSIFSPVDYDQNGDRKPYKENLNECWVIRGPLENEGVTFETNFFELETNYDFLRITHDVPETLSSFTGENGPNFTTSTPYANLTFTTDSDIGKDGFEIWFGYGSYTSSFSSPAPSSENDDNGLSVATIVGIVIGIVVFIIIVALICCCCCQCCCFETKKKKQVTPSYTVNQQGRRYPVQNTQAGPRPPPPPSYRAVVYPANYSSPANYNAPNQLPWMTSSSKPGMPQPVGYPGTPGPDPAYRGALPPLRRTYTGTATGYYAYLQREPSAPFASNSRAPIGFEHLQLEGTGRAPAFNDPAYPSYQPQTPAPPPVMQEPTSGKSFKIADLATAVARAGTPKRLRPADGPMGRGEPRSEEEILRGAKARLTWQRTKIPGPAEYNAPR